MFLALDLGASFLKGAVFSDGIEHPIAEFKLPGLALSALQSSDASFLNPLAIKVIEVCKRYPLTSVYIAEEMHGFAIVPEDQREGYFYSWRYHWDYEDSCVHAFRTPQQFEKVTGLKYRNGYGIWGLLSGVAMGKNKVGSLSSLLLTLIGHWQGSADISVLHSQGFINVKQREYIDFLIDRFGNSLPIINDKPGAAVIGEISVDGRVIPVYGGVGDLVATLNGISIAGKDDASLIINSGTGSQIAYLGSSSVEPSIMGKNFEKRLSNPTDYFVLSHIPCGRAINFFKNIALGLFPMKSEADFWAEFGTVRKEMIRGSSDGCYIPVFDLGVFDTSSYGGPGSITNLFDSVTFDDFLKGLVVSFVDQYKSLISSVRPEPTSLVFCGGVFNRNPNLVEMIRSELQRDYSQCLSFEIGPFNGLRKLTQSERSI